VLDDHAHRLAEDVAVDVVGAEQQQRAGPIDRLGDARRLLQVELADLVDDLDELAGDRVRQLRSVEADDLQLMLELGVVEPEIQAPPLQRLGQLARVVAREQHDGLRLGVDSPELRNADLEIGQQLEQHRLELLVGLVDLVDQQHDGVGGGDRGHQRPRQQELLAEDVVLHVLPAGVARFGLDSQQLLAVVPLVQRLGLVEALVALEPDQGPIEVAGERLRQLRLADTGGSLDQHRLAELRREERHQRGRFARQIAGPLEAGGDVLDGAGGVRHPSRIGFYVLVAFLPAVAQSQINVILALIIVGAVIGVFGHIIKSKPMIVAGILTIALASAYFEFFVAKIT
jgi:hypothetical protein